MADHRFAVLTAQGESGTTSEEFRNLFADDVLFNSPFLLKPLQNKELTIRFLQEVFAQGDRPTYTHQFTDNKSTTLFLWEGDVRGPDGRAFTLEGSLAITEGEDGRIHEVTSYLRPLQVGALFMKPMIASAASALPNEYWDAPKAASLK